MAKRTRLTLDQVLEQCDDSNDDYDECIDDLDEPIMEGSDDEFSDLEWNDFDQDDSTP